MEANCIDTMLWEQVCDSCNGSAILKVLSLVVEILGYGVGIVGVIAIMIVGIQYLTAGSSAEKTIKARTRLANMLIGIMVYVGLFGIYTFLMPTGRLGMSVLVGSPENCPSKTQTSIIVYEPLDTELSPRGTVPDTEGTTTSSSTVVATAKTDLPVAPLNKDSTDVGCDPRTSFVKKYNKAHVEGKKVSINLCKVNKIGGGGKDGTLVNSRVSGAYAALAEAYKKTTGNSISASSSFRSYEEQEYFYKCYQSKNCNNGRQAAKPGMSKHEGGLAIDFSMNSTLDNWFSKNLKTFDLWRSVSGEPWHVNPIWLNKYYP